MKAAEIARETGEERRGGRVVDEDACDAEFAAEGRDSRGPDSHKRGEELVASAARACCVVEVVAEFSRERVGGARSGKEAEIVRSGPVREGGFGGACVSVVAERGAVQRECAERGMKCGVAFVTRHSAWSAVVRSVSGVSEAPV